MKLFKVLLFSFAFLFLFSFPLAKEALADNKATNLAASPQCGNSGITVDFSWTKADCYLNNCSSYPLIGQSLDYTLIANLPPDDNRWVEANSGGFSKNHDIGTSASSKTIPGFAPSLTYYWRINTDYGGYLGGWQLSNSRSFTTPPCANASPSPSISPFPTQPPGKGGLSGITDFLASGGKIGSIGDLVSGIYPIILGLAGIILVIFIVISGIQIITSNGDPKALNSARGRLIFAAVGFAVILGAYAITMVIQSIFGINIF